MCTLHTITSLVLRMSCIFHDNTLKKNHRWWYCMWQWRVNTCDSAVAREQRWYTQEMNDTLSICGEVTSCFIPTFNPARLTRPKLIAKLRCLVVYMYWIMAPIPCGQIILTISFTVASGLPLFCWTGGDSVCNWYVLRKTAKITCKDTLVQSIWKWRDLLFFFCADLVYTLYVIFSLLLPPFPPIYEIKPLTFCSVQTAKRSPSRKYSVWAQHCIIISHRSLADTQKNFSSGATFPVLCLRSNLYYTFF